MDTQTAVGGNVKTEKGSSFDVIVIGAGAVLAGQPAPGAFHVSARAENGAERHGNG